MANDAMQQRRDRRDEAARIKKTAIDNRARCHATALTKLGNEKDLIDASIRIENRAAWEVMLAMIPPVDFATSGGQSVANLVERIILAAANAGIVTVL